MATKAPELNCNSCNIRLALFGKQPVKVKSSVKSYLTNCQHVFCENCRKKCTETCLECSKQCRFIEINDKMPSHLKEVFQPIDKLQNGYTTAVQFQMQQDMVRIKNYEKMAERYDAKEKEEKLRYEQEKKRYFETQQQKAAFTAMCKGLSAFVRNRSNQSPARQSQQRTLPIYMETNHSIPDFNSQFVNNYRGAATQFTPKSSNDSGYPRHPI